MLIPNGYEGHAGLSMDTIFRASVEIQTGGGDEEAENASAPPPVYHLALYSLDSSPHRLQVKLQEIPAIFFIREPRLVHPITHEEKAAQIR